MAASKETLQALEPLRVAYATGRMLGVNDFADEQTYHRARLARALVAGLGTGTLSGLNVQSNGAAKKEDVELQVTPGLAIDRAGRILDVPYQVCIRVQKYLEDKVKTAASDLSQAFRNGAIVADVFVSFVACDRGMTPSFATMDDYDATDAFTSNRLLDAFAMQLVLRPDADPKLPVDPWRGLGANPKPDDVKQHILKADTGPSFRENDAPLDASGEQGLIFAYAPSDMPEYPSDPDFDRTAVFLARVKITATSADPKDADPTKIDIDNSSRLFVYSASLVARWAGLPTAKG